MPRHALFVDELASAAGELVPPGWRVTRVEDASLASTWLRHGPPDLLLVGRRPAGLSAARFVRAVRLDHDASLVPLVQVRGDEQCGELRAEPDAWVEAGGPGGAAFAEALAARAERLREGVRAEARLLLPSDLDRLVELTSLLDPWFAACDFGGHLRSQLTLAVRELAANAIEWGHRHDRSLPVSVHLRLDQEKFSALVRDRGPGFDPCALPHAARPGDPLSHLAVRSSIRLREGGFGILMARGLVDQLCYNDAGNEACLIKYLPARPRRRSRPAFSPAAP